MADLFETNTPPPSIERCARVVVERGIDQPAARATRTGPSPAGDEGLTYAVPDELTLAEGDRVEVPLGRGSTPTGGTVVTLGGPELLGGLDPRKIKQILRRTGAALPPQLLDLARWMAAYYCCPLGMAIATVTPAAVKHATGARTVEMITPGDSTKAPGKPSPSIKRALESLQTIPEADWPIEPRTLASRLGCTNAGPINRLVDAGVLKRVQIDTVKARAAEHLPLTGSPNAPIEAPTLTEEQQHAVEGIGAKLGQGFSAHLLHGVTGSGKTEVYLRLIEQVTEAGKGAIVLVPEISLTPQTAGRFLERLGRGDPRSVAVLHSGLTASQRHEAWKRAASGEARVVVGARSSVFAPIPKLGLIVVDEEHDGSYKQDQLPRYHARDVAVKRAHAEGFPVILGSATPSLESWLNAAGDPPRYHLWSLPKRATGASLPTVEVVNLINERKLLSKSADKTESDLPAMSADFIGPTLINALRETFAADQQAILLLNRRGFASAVVCPSPNCGWSLGCTECSTRMVLHRAGLRPGQRAPKGFARCHHCHSEQTVPSTCPLCGRPPILVGGGTQRIEDDLPSLLNLRPGLDFERVDADTMKSGTDYFDVLSRFARRELKLLLGTQMLAKGHDFPGVTLVGVISADTALHLPDFRASERTYQLISQVAGRAGRAGQAGRVIVQTMNPDDPAIVLASRHDYVRFARGELEHRWNAGLPPFARMCRVVARDEKHERARARASEITGALRAHASSDIRIEGPFDAPLARLHGRFRVAVDVTARTAASLQDLLGSVRAQGVIKSDAATAVDVDPVSLL